MASDEELYQQYLKETSQGADPEYQQYLRETGQLQEAPSAPEVVNEIHPELSDIKGLKTRTVYKALGTDPEASFNYLQKEYPNMNFKKDSSGEVLVKSPTEAQWRKLDPSGFDVRDISDLAYDVPAGIAQGAVTAASGIAGATAGGIGAIPAAMAGSAASGAALETARQGLGKYFMPDQEFSGTDIGIAGATGAVSPLLFGTGATAKQALAAGGKELAKDVMSSQRGLLGRGYDAVAGKVGPMLGELVSGEKAPVIKKAANMLPELKASETNPEVVTSGLKQAVQDIPEKLKTATKQVGDIMGEARNVIDNASIPPGLVKYGEKAKPQGSIPTASFTDPFKELAEKLSSGASGSEGQMADLQALNTVLKREFDNLPENMTAEQAQMFSNRMRELSKQYGMNYSKGGTTVSATQGASAVDAQIASAFEKTRRNVNESIIKRLEQVAPEYKNKYDDAVESYGYLKDLAKNNEAKFKNPKSVRDTLTRATRDDIEAQNLLDLEQATGVDLTELAKEQAAFRSFSKPSFDIRSLGGSTSTSRAVPLALAGGALGYYAGQQSGTSPYLTSMLGLALGSKAGSPAALRAYMQANKTLRAAPQKLGVPYQAAPYTLMNMKRNENK